MDLLCARPPPFKTRAVWSAGRIPLTHMCGCELLEPGEQGLLAREAISLTEGN